MRQSLLLLTILFGVSPAAVFAQAGAPQGRASIESSDMAPHDSATQPSTLDSIRNGIQNNDADRRGKYLRDKLGPARPAEAHELAAGAVVNDNTGALIATIVSVDQSGVVVSSGAQKVKVPAGAFGHNRAGLLLDMTKAQFDQIVAKASAGS